MGAMVAIEVWREWKGDGRLSSRGSKPRGMSRVQGGSRLKRTFACMCSCACVYSMYVCMCVCVSVIVCMCVCEKEIERKRDERERNATMQKERSKNRLDRGWKETASICTSRTLV